MKPNRLPVMEPKTFDEGRITFLDGILTHDIMIGKYQHRIVYYANNLQGEAYLLGDIQVFKYLLAFKPNREYTKCFELMHRSSVERLNCILNETGWKIHNNEWKQI